MEHATLRRKDRAALFATTALVLPVLCASPCRAQTIGAETTPQGGVVVGGSAAIGQAPGRTTIDQASQRAAINWQSFNVGANARVQFNQPSSSAIALNRVVGGNLSIINGRIDANGQIVLINQSGAVFAKGSQVNAESVVVATSDIPTKSFMAGSLAFTGAPAPGARIVNDGTITAGQAGLVGLVAPQVANAGVITARLGQVVLAGASAFTLDLYGDRLISLDVTRAVRALDLGGKTVPALVTNSGVIVADGGHVTLTARQADALVTELVDAGGTIRADSVGAAAGTISLAAVGGNISIAGSLLARGRAPGATGGAVEALATGTVAVARNAAIDVSGAAGGGAVALGTDIARAREGAADKTAPRAAAVTVAAGATIRADATGAGNGGKLVLLSAHETGFQGAASVRGGPAGGNGGVVEISSGGVISLGGTVLATAAEGRAGDILLDPTTLIVATDVNGINNGSVANGGTTTFGGTTGTDVSVINVEQLDSLSGNVLLEASSLVSVAAAIDMTSASALSLVSLGDVSISAPITVSGSLDVTAAGVLTVRSELSADDIKLSSGTATNFDALINAGTVLALAGAGQVNETSFSVNGVGLVGTIDAPTLVSAGTVGGNVSLPYENAIGTLAGFTLAAGRTLALDDTGLLTIAGPVTAPFATLVAGSFDVTGDYSGTDLALQSTGNVTGAGAVSVATLSSGGTTIGGNVSLTGNGNTINTLAGFALASGKTFALDDTGALDVAGPLAATAATLSAGAISITGHVTATDLALESSGGITESGSINATTLDSGGTTIGGDVTLTGGNTIGTLAGFTLAAAKTLVLDDTGLLTVAGPVVAPSATLSAGTLAIDGSVSGTDLALLSTDGITESGGIDEATLGSGGGTIGGNVALTLNNTIGTLAGFTVATGGTLVLDDTGPLTVAGPVAVPVTTLSADTLTLTGNISGTELVLKSGGDITGAGVISVATLRGGGSIGGDVSLTGANAVGTLAGFTLAAGNTLTFDDAGALDVAGPIEAGAATLSAGTLALAGNISVTSLGLGSTGTITEAGTIDAATLRGAGIVGGDAALTGSNTIADLAGFTVAAGGTLTLDDSRALTVTGAVSAPVITLAASRIAFDGDLTAATELALGGGGTITQPGGTISAGTLIGLGTFTGPVSLGGANDISNLDEFALDGGFTLNDAASLTVIGLITTTGAISLTGTDLGESGAGALAAATLTTGAGSFSGGVSLGGANTFATITAFTASSAAIEDTEALTIAGLVSTANGLTLDDTGGGITEVTGGTLDAASLGGSAAGDVALTVGNAVGTLAGFTVASNTLTLDDGIALTVGNDTAAGATLKAPAITLAGTLSVTNLLSLHSAGDVTETAGLIDAGTLSGDASTGGIALTLGNTIAVLDSLTAGGDFALVDNRALQVAASVTARNVTLVTPTLTVDAGVSATAAGGTLALASDGFAAGAADLLNATGTIEIAPFTAGRAIDIGGDAAGALDLPASFIAALDPATAEILIGAAAGRQGGAITIDNVTSFGVTLLDLEPGAGTITDNGTLTADTLAFGGGGFGQATTTGALTLAALVGSGVITGPVSLASTLNSIAALGPLSVSTGGLILVDSASLDVASSVSAADITLLDLAALDIGAPLSVANGGTVNLVADTITDAGAGITAVGGLVAFAPYSGTDVQFGGAAPSDTLGLGAGLGTLVDAAILQIGSAAGHVGAALAVAGPLTVTAPTLALTGTSIGFTGRLAELGLVTLSGGGVTEAANATIAAGTLAGTVAGAALTGPNQIGTLGDFSSSTYLSLDDDTSLAIAGLIRALTLALGGTASIGETGTIVAASLASLGTIGGDVDLTGDNTIGTLAGFTVATGQTLTLDDIGLLTVAGPVKAPVATLSAGTISITGAFSAALELALASNDGIFETGAIVAATLASVGTIGGNVDLAGANTINTLAGFALAATGTLTLDDTGLLTVAGPLTAPTATLSAGAISITGGISAATELALASTGAVSETGTIVAATLASVGAIGGSVALTGANTIGTLAGFTVANGEALSLDDTGLLTVAGPLVAPAATLSAGAISITGGIFATELALASTGAIAETGAIVAATLASLGTIGGDVALTGGNTIGTLAGFALAPGQSLVLDDTGLLTVAGPLTAPTATLSADTISITGGISVSAELALASNEGIFETGTIDAVSLSSGGTTIGGNVALTGSNTIDTLAGFALAPGFTLMLDDTGLLNVAGPLTASFATLSAGAISITGGISAATELALASTGGIEETGFIDTPLLISAGTIGGDVALTGANRIGTLGGFALASGTTLTLDDIGTLAVAGPLDADTATLSAGFLSITGGISAATELALASTGGIEETGFIDTPLLTSAGSIGGNVALTGPNSIGTLGGFAIASGTTLTLDDTGTLIVAGPLDADIATLLAGFLSITGSISAATALALASTGGIAESGAIDTPLLTSAGTIGGDVALTGPNNIGTLGNFAVAAGQTFTLDDTGPLDVAGPLIASIATLSAGALSITGGIAATELALESPGDITGAGVINAATLTSGGATVGGGVDLTGNNSIATLGNFALAGDFVLNDVAPLAIAGQLATPAAVSLTVQFGIVETTGAIAAGTLAATGPSGDILLGNANRVGTLGDLEAADAISFTDEIPLAIAGDVATEGTLTLRDAAGIAEAGGAINAAALSSGGASDGDVILAGLNGIAVLAGFTVAAGDTLQLADTEPLTVAGPLAAAYATLAAPAITIAGGIDAGLLALQAAGDAVETTGTITAGTLTTGNIPTGGSLLLNGANRIATLGVIDAGGDLVLNDLEPLLIPGPVSLGGTLALLDTGAITETADAIAAAELTSDGGTIGGAAILDQPGNVIRRLGNFAALGGLTLADTVPLDLAGDIFSGTGALGLSVAAGGITQTAGTIDARTLNATAPVIVLPDANQIAGLGAIDAGRLFVNGVATLAGPVLAGEATIVAPGNLDLAGSASIDGTLSLASGGSIVQPAGGTLRAGDATLTADGSISLSGTTRVADQLSLVAPRGIGHGAGVLDAGTLTGRAGSLASFAAFTDIATLGGFLLNDGPFTLDNAGPLTFVGPLSATSVSLAVAGPLTLQGSPEGGLFVQGNDAPKDVLAPRPGDSVISVTPGADGTPPAVVETGVFYVNAGPNAPNYDGGGGPATVFLDVAPSGNVNFAPAPPNTTGLDGPGIDLEASVGSTGIIAGNVNLFRLVVLSAATVALTGFLDGIGGPEGAAKGIVNPFPNPHLQFNACPISSVNCTILPVESLPTTNPLQNFDIAQRKKHRLNKNIQLPGIAIRDY